MECNETKISIEVGRCRRRRTIIKQSFTKDDTEKKIHCNFFRALFSFCFDFGYQFCIYFQAHKDLIASLRINYHMLLSDFPMGGVNSARFSWFHCKILFKFFLFFH